MLDGRPGREDVPCGAFIVDAEVVRRAANLSAHRQFASEEIGDAALRFDRVTALAVAAEAEQTKLVGSGRPHYRIDDQTLCEEHLGGDDVVISAVLTGSAQLGRTDQPGRPRGGRVADTVVVLELNSGRELRHPRILIV